MYDEASHLVGEYTVTKQVVWTWDPDAFGVSQPSLMGVEVNLRFPGQYYDKHTGLYYNHNRYYSPQLGRYLEPDPIGLAGGLNPYAYADNNPVMNVDESGLNARSGLVKPLVELLLRQLEIKKRPDTPGSGDASKPTERAARREVMRREGIPTSTSYNIRKLVNPTDTRKIDPSTGNRVHQADRFIIERITVGGRKSGGERTIGSLEHHPSGHIFHDTKDYIGPHFHSEKPKGHISYEE